jgi:ABC-2 type transport system ATP-binding protein
MKIIQVQEILKRFGQTQALKGVSFDVNRGEVLGLLGPNGSGKTTTLEILMGIAKADSGSVNFSNDKGVVEKIKIGSVFQVPVYYDTLTVAELIKFYSRFYRRPTEKIPEYLAMVNLQDKLDTQFRNLSGGQKQQLSIVLSLVNDPDILFFDEPSNALDPAVRHKIWDLIRLLKKNGKTIVFTTHYIEEAEALADRVVIMNKGEVIVTDEPKNIVGKYSGQYLVTMSIEGAPAPVNLECFDFGNVHIANGVYSFSVASLSACFFSGIQRLSEKYVISDLKIGRSSLEDVFVKLTGEGI